MVIPHQEKSTISPQPLGRFSRAPIPLERPSKTTHSEHKRSPRQRGSIAFYGNFTKERAITPEPLRAWSWDYASWKALANPVKMSPRPCRTGDFQVAAHWRCWTSADLNARFCFYSLPSSALPALFEWSKSRHGSVQQSAGNSLFGPLGETE